MGVMSNKVQAPHDIGEVILNAVNNLHEYQICVRSYKRASRPMDKANGGIMVAHLTAPGYLSCLLNKVTTAAKNKMPAANPPKNKYSEIGQCH